HRHRGSRLPAQRRGDRDRNRPRRADRRRRVARGAAGARASRTGLPGGYVRARRRLKGERMGYRLGVDVGGTFTDLLLSHDESGALHRVKTPSTPADPSEGVLNGIRRICEASGVSPQEIGYVMHGTTVATNALLESKGARV